MQHNGQKERVYTSESFSLTSMTQFSRPATSIFDAVQLISREIEQSTFDQPSTTVDIHDTFQNAEKIYGRWDEAAGT